MTEKKFSMGKTFNCSFGYIDMPSDILEVAILDDFLKIECEDGIYHITKSTVCNKEIMIKKIFSKDERLNSIFKIIH